jgi:hypothetical protein
VVGLIAAFLAYVILTIVSPMRESVEADQAMPAGEMACPG